MLAGAAQTAQFATIDRRLASHDRAIADLKEKIEDLGKKCFGFTKMDAGEIAGLKARIPTSHGGA